MLIIKSIDRLGRNYDMIIEEWQRITKKIGADIKVLDMELLDTRKKEGLTGKFISDLVLQILSYVAQVERENTRQRQAEGIRIAKAKGIKFGRPKLKGFDDVLFKYWNNEYKNIDEACEEANISRGTFFRRVKELKEKRNDYE